MYARVAQEPGMESRRSCCGQERNGKSAEAYAEHLEANLQSRLDRAKSGRYRAPPGATGAHPEGRWDGDPTDRHSDLRGQGPAARGGDGDRRSLRAGVSRLLVWLSTWSLTTPSAARGPERGMADGWWMDRRGRYSKVFRQRRPCPPPRDPSATHRGRSAVPSH